MDKSPVIVDFTTFDRRLVTIVNGLPHVTVHVQPCVNRGVLHDCHRFAPGCGIGHGSLPRESHPTVFLPGAIVQSQRTPNDCVLTPPMGHGLNQTGTCRPSRPPATLFNAVHDVMWCMGQFENSEEPLERPVTRLGNSNISRGKGTVVRGGRDLVARRGK